MENLMLCDYMLLAEQQRCPQQQWITNNNYAFIVSTNESSEINYYEGQPWMRAIPEWEQLLLLLWFYFMHAQKLVI